MEIKNESDLAKEFNLSRAKVREFARALGLELPKLGNSKIFSGKDLHAMRARIAEYKKARADLRAMRAPAQST